MGIRIESLTKQFTVRDLLEFLYHLDNIYENQVFQFQDKQAVEPYAFRPKLKPEDSLFVGEISRKSPLVIVVVPMFPYERVIDGFYTILLVVKSVRDLLIKRDIRDSGSRANRRRYIIREELEKRRIVDAQNETTEEIEKLTRTVIAIDGVEWDPRSFNDFFNNSRRQ